MPFPNFLKYLKQIWQIKQNCLTLIHFQGVSLLACSPVSSWQAVTKKKKEGLLPPTRSALFHLHLRMLPNTNHLQNKWNLEDLDNMFPLFRSQRWQCTVIFAHRHRESLSHGSTKCCIFTSPTINASIPALPIRLYHQIIPKSTVICKSLFVKVLFLFMLRANDKENPWIFGIKSEKKATCSYSINHQAQIQIPLKTWQKIIK